MGFDVVAEVESRAFFVLVQNADPYHKVPPDCWAQHLSDLFGEPSC